MTEGTQIDRIGPIDTHADSSRFTGEGYSEDRGIREIEEELKKAGINFSFLEHINAIAETLPEGETIRILDSGCGNGNTLKQIKGLPIARPIHTTGITMAERNIESLEAGGIDYIVLGSLQNAFEKGKIPGPYHFVLDFHGPSFYGDAGSENPMGVGNRALGIYSQILAENGSALLVLPRLDPTLVPILGEEPRQRTVSLLEKNNFVIVKTGRSNALVQKRSPKAEVTL